MLFSMPSYASDTLTTADGVVIDYEISGTGVPLVRQFRFLLRRKDNAKRL